MSHGCVPGCQGNAWTRWDCQCSPFRNHEDQDLTVPENRGITPVKYEPAAMTQQMEEPWVGDLPGRHMQRLPPKLLTKEFPFSKNHFVDKDSAKDNKPQTPRDDDDELPAGLTLSRRIAWENESEPNSQVSTLLSDPVSTSLSDPVSLSLSDPENPQEAAGLSGDLNDLGLESAGGLMRAMPSARRLRKKARPSTISSNSDGLSAIPDTEDGIVLSFNIVLLGSASSQVATCVCEDETSLVLHVADADHNLVELRFIPVCSFGDEIPSSVFMQLVSTAFLFILELHDLKSMPDQLADIGRRVTEVKARCTHRQSQMAGGQEPSFKPKLMGLILKGFDSTEARKAFVDNVLAWAHSFNVEMLANNQPVELEKDELHKSLGKQVAEHMQASIQCSSMDSKIVSQSSRIPRLTRGMRYLACCQTPSRHE